MTAIAPKPVDTKVALNALVAFVAKIMPSPAFIAATLLVINSAVAAANPGRSLLPIPVTAYAIVTEVRNSMFLATAEATAAIPFKTLEAISPTLLANC